MNEKLKASFGTSWLFFVVLSASFDVEGWLWRHVRRDGDGSGGGAEEGQGDDEHGEFSWKELQNKMQSLHLFISDLWITIVWFWKNQLELWTYTLVRSPHPLFLCILRKRGRGFSPLIIDYHFEVRRQRELLLRLEEEMSLVRKQREQVGHLYFSWSLSYFSTKLFTKKHLLKKTFVDNINTNI